MPTGQKGVRGVGSGESGGGGEVMPGAHKWALIDRPVPGVMPHVLLPPASRTPKDDTQGPEHESVYPSLHGSVSMEDLSYEQPWTGVGGGHKTGPRWSGWS